MFRYRSTVSNDVRKFVEEKQPAYRVKRFHLLTCSGGFTVLLIRSRSGSALSNHSTILRYWLDRHNAGDGSATEELIRFSEDRFRILIQSRLRQFNRLRRFEDTDDVLVGVQTRIASALRARRFDTLNGFLQFGGTLVRNQLIDFTRRYFGPLGAGRQEVRPTGDNSTADSPDPAADAGDWNRKADIDTVIETLPPMHRELFHALYYLGLTQEDAADLLDISVSTLKRRWLEARQLFLSRYEDPN